MNPSSARPSGSQSGHNDAALLAPLISGGSCNASAHELSARLLRRHGGVRGLLHADSRALLAEKGVGAARLAILQALPELARRYFRESLPAGTAIRSPTDTEEFLTSHLRHLEHEIFCCIFLDNRHRVLRFDELFRGTINGTSVYPREVVKEALAVNAAAVILAHNHPSGVAEPSEADERITRKLKSALDLVDIRLLDHLIIGTGQATSLASCGML